MANETIMKVSFEEAHLLIENERKNDDSEFMEGGYDPGTKVKDFLLNDFSSENTLENLIEKADLISLWKVCEIEKLQDRGLKFLSTGEMKKVLLFKSFLLLSYKKIQKIILINIYDGLDTESLRLLKEIFETENGFFQKRFSEFVEFENIKANNSLKDFQTENFHELENKFQEILFDQEKIKKEEKDFQTSNILQENKVKNDFQKTNLSTEKKELVRMENVFVKWGEVSVLENLSWEVFEGEHTLVLGPNGCGKTTLLELITGDNPQVYCNDVYIFGRKRGTGESIWDIKKELGKVSYNLHLEYRLLGSVSVEKVLLSGFYDSIGLYEAPKLSQTKKVEAWLSFANMSELLNKDFSKLSYGLQRAVLILRALIKKPKLLILDEPCHGLSFEERSFVLKLISLIGNENHTTIIHVTHDEDEYLDFEKRIFRFLPGTEKSYQIERR